MRKLFILMCLISSSSVFASGAEKFSVVNVGVVRSGNYAFIDISPDQSVSNCTRKNQVRWELTSDADKAILSLAITAQTANKKLLISLTDDDCLGDSPRPNVVYLLSE